MKTSRVLLSLSAALGLSLPLAATAAPIDLNKLKCQEFLGRSPEETAAVVAWLDGFYMDEEAPASVDLDKLKDNAAKLSAYCSHHPEVNVSAAAEELFGK